MVVGGGVIRKTSESNIKPQKLIYPKRSELNLTFNCLDQISGG